MKKDKKYWETENSETVEFGNSFMRCFDKVGKLQFGTIYKNKNTGEKKFFVKFVLDKKELVGSNEGVAFLKQTIEDWETGYGED